MVQINDASRLVNQQRKNLEHLLTQVQKIFPGGGIRRLFEFANGIFLVQGIFLIISFCNSKKFEFCKENGPDLPNTTPLDPRMFYLNITDRGTLFLLVFQFVCTPWKLITCRCYNFLNIVEYTFRN